MKNLKKLLVILMIFVISPVLVTATDISSNNQNTIENVTLVAPKFTITTGNGTNKLVITNFTEGVNYEVYRSLNKNLNYVSIGTTNTSEFIDDKVNVGYTYYYRIQAISGIDYINSAPVAKKVSLATPKAKVVSNNKTTLTVSWDAVEGASGYQVYRATSKNGKYTKVATTTNTSFVNTKLTVGKGYYYRVRAYKKYSKVGYSAFSSVVGAVPKVGTTTITGASYDHDKVKLTWNKVSGANGYTIYKLVGKKYKAIKNTTSLSFIDSKLTTGAKYTYVVRAYATSKNKKYYGNSSKAIQVVPTLRKPNVVVDNKLSRYSLKISTAKVPGATGYYYYKLNNGNYELIAKTKQLSVIDKNVTLGSTQTYKVVAYKTIKGKEYTGFETIKSEVVRPAQTKINYNREDYNRYQVAFTLSEMEDTDKVHIRVYVKINDQEEALIEDSDAPETAVLNKQSFIITQSNLILGSTYTYRVIYTVNGIDNIENSITIKPYLDKPVVSIINYNYGQIAVGVNKIISGADGYEIYASTKKTGKYNKITEADTTGAAIYNTGYGRGLYYKIRAYKLVNGVRVYSAYSDIKGYTTNMKLLNKVPVKLTLVNDSKSYLIIKGASATKVSVSTNYVKYKIKLNFSQSYMRKNMIVRGKVYFYDYSKQQISYVSYSVSLKKGTKKNWSKTITVTLPKNAVYLAV